LGFDSSARSVLRGPLQAAWPADVRATLAGIDLPARGVGRLG
jgi:hypothetical protein